MILEINNLAFPVSPLKLQQNANIVIIHGALAPETQLEHRKNSLLSSFKIFTSKQFGTLVGIEFVRILV